MFGEERGDARRQGTENTPPSIVIPAEAGIHWTTSRCSAMDPGFRRDDGGGPPFSAGQAWIASPVVRNVTARGAGAAPIRLPAGRGLLTSVHGPTRGCTNGGEIVRRARRARAARRCRGGSPRLLAGADLERCREGRGFARDPRRAADRPGQVSARFF